MTIELTSGVPVFRLERLWSGKFMFGWQSFSSMANEVWVDDLVLSTARVGCN